MRKVELGGSDPLGKVWSAGAVPLGKVGWGGARPGGKVGWGSPFPAPDPISTLSQASELAERGEPGAIPDRQRILPERPCGTPGNVGGLWPHRPE